jgi:hypothetical protein
MAGGRDGERLSAADAATQRLRHSNPQATRPAKTPLRNGFPLRAPPTFTICLPTPLQTARGLKRAMKRAVRVIDPRVARGLEDRQAPMTGIFFVTAVGGPANSCGKTRPL